MPINCWDGQAGGNVCGGEVIVNCKVVAPVQQIRTYQKRENKPVREPMSLCMVLTSSILLPPKCRTNFPLALCMPSSRHGLCHERKRLSWWMVSWWGFLQFPVSLVSSFLGLRLRRCSQAVLAEVINVGVMLTEPPGTCKYIYIKYNKTNKKDIKQPLQILRKSE